MSADKTSPRPWRIVDRGGQGPVVIDKDKIPVVAFDMRQVPQDMANAKIAVKAVNNHDDLLEAAQMAYDWLSQCHEGTHQAEIAGELLKAIKQAKY